MMKTQYKNRSPFTYIIISQLILLCWVTQFLYSQDNKYNIRKSEILLLPNVIPVNSRLTENSETGSQRWFTDVTNGAGLEFQNVNGDPKQIPIIDQNGQGVAFLDYNNDGWLDIYLLSGSTIKRWKNGNNPGNALFRNNGDGTFTDVTDEAGVQGNGWSNGVAAADYDGDEYVDLYITMWGANILYRNNGDGTFTDVADELDLRDKRWSCGASFADLDNDSDLDLYVSNYVKFDPDDYPKKDTNGSDCSYKGILTGCAPVLYEGEMDILYRNNGDGTFTDISELAGITATIGYRGFGVIFADLDLDNDADLYIGCDMMPNLYLVNQGDGTFLPGGEQRGGTHNAVGMHESGMGVAMGDVNEDGYPDIFSTNFANEKNTLFSNWRGMLADVTEEAGLAKHFMELGWGAVMADFNNDGFLDIFHVNGHIYPQVEQLVEYKETYKQPWRLYLGNGNGNFREATIEDGWEITNQYSSRGTAAADYDNDGDMDILIGNHNDYPTLLRNETSGNYLMLQLIGSGKNSQGIGTRVAVKVAERIIWRFAYPNQGYLSSQDPRLHFGLGSSKEVEEIVVYWPGSGIERIPGPQKGNRFITIKQGEGIINNQ